MQAKRAYNYSESMECKDGGIGPLCPIGLSEIIEGGKRSKEGGYREVVFRFLQMLGRNHWYFSLYIQASPISLTPF